MLTNGRNVDTIVTQETNSKRKTNEMITTNGLRLNQVVRVEYRKADGAEVKRYDGTIDDVDAKSILVKLDYNPERQKDEFRRLLVSKITSLIVG